MAIAAVAVTFFTPPVHAGLLIGNSFGNLNGNGPAVLYDVNATTGEATNHRTLTLAGVPYARSVNGIAYNTSDGNLYGLTAANGTLIRIDMASGAVSVVGATGLFTAEGDLAFDPTTGLLYGGYTLGSNPQLFTLNTSTGAATLLSSSYPASRDISAFTFDSAGTLYALDTRNEELLTLNKATGAVLSNVSLSRALGNAAGLTFDRDLGTFYVADGGSANGPPPTNNLYTLNVATGQLTLRGPTGLTTGNNTGLAGLTVVPVAVPEPSGLAFGLVGLMTLALGGYRRR